MANENTKINFELALDDSDVEKAMMKFLKSVEDAGEGVDNLSKESQEAFKAIGAAIEDQNKRYAELAQKITDANNKQSRYKRILKEVKGGVKDALKEYELFGFTIGDITDRIGKMNKGINALTKNWGTLGKVFNKIAKGGFFLILTAIASLVAFLVKTEKGMDALNRIIAPLQATLTVITNRVFKLGEAFSMLLNGDWKGFQREVSGAFSGITKEIKEAQRAALALVDAEIKLRGIRRDNDAFVTTQLKKINELNRLSQDENKSIKERRKALKELSRLESNIAQRRIREKQLEIDALENQKKIDKESFSQQDELNDLIREREELVINLGNIQEDYSAEQQMLIQQQIDKVKQLRETYIDLVDSITSDARLAEIELIEDPIERLTAQREIAFEELGERIKEAQQAAIRAGLELPPDFDERTEVLFEQIRIKFAQEIEKVQREGFTGFDFLSGENGLIESLSTQDLQDSINEEGQRIGEILGEGIKEGTQNVFDGVRDFFADLFGVSDEDLALLAETALGIGENLTQGLESLTQAQIIEQERVLDALDRQIAETERKLEREIERRNAGFANSADNLEKQLEDEQKLREEAEAKRLELEKKAANQRILINTVEQTSEIVLAAARLASSQAKFGVIGLFTALAGLSVLFKIIASAKSQAAEFSEAPKFRTGTEFVHGPGNAKSDSIRAYLSRGERVVDADLNKEIGGSKITNKELVENFKIGMQVREMFTGVEPFETSFGNVDVVKALNQQIIEKQHQVELQERELRFDVMERAFEKAAYGSIGELIQYHESKPTEVTRGGERFYEWKEGGTIRRVQVKKN